MPPIVATIITAIFVGYFFRRDIRERPNVTGALWLPTIWLLLIGSRTFTQWMEVAGINLGGGSYEDGTPADAVVFFLLIVAGAWVLYRRHLNLGEFASHNRLLTLFLLYCLISVVWSDFPFVAFKRWIKILGHPIMALIIFTEPDPREAVIRMMKRCMYVVAPVSILFIKYFPQWSHEDNPYGGPANLTGISLDKNMEGSMCFILGFFCVWYLLVTLQREKSRERRNEIFICVIFLALFAWLFYSVKSSTSEVSCLVGVAVMLFAGLRFIDPRRIFIYLVTGSVVFALANWMFGLMDLIIDWLGKDPTLTDRTKVWALVLQLQDSPVLGTGFESFWLGGRKDAIWDHFWWHPIQAHNGYLETYLNLGVIGVGFMLLLIISAFLKGQRAWLIGDDFGRFRMGFVAAFVLYNWTEAAFKATHPVWFVFYIAAIDLAVREYAGRTDPEAHETGFQVEPSGGQDGFEGEIVA